MIFSRRSLHIVICLISIVTVIGLRAQDRPQEDAKAIQDGMQWRLIGPYRGGRVVAVAGVPGSATHFYFGAVDGGIWETTSAGTVWTPISDQQKIGSVGALAVAPSDEKVLYAGTGEADIRSDLASGNGVYRSSDGGHTWVNVGLRDSRQISRIVIDPADAKTVYVGVLGNAYGPSDERGVYKSTDGGASWKRVLNDGPSTGVSDLAIATKNPKVLFAGTWNAHRPPWSTYAPLEGDSSGIERTTDGGVSWTKLSEHGLPGGRWGRVGVAVSADGRRVYAAIDDKEQSGIYRSDDGGDNWMLVNKDPRLTSRAWYFNCLTIDPQNPDVLYIPNIALYRTEDGGKTFTVVRGAPGGDDYHQIWVDPQNANHLLLGVDQGATISLDRGATWTTWYNQPTAQLYHVTTDDSFPYVVYGAQQDSGAVAVASRTDHGSIGARDWFQPGSSESGYLVIDPRDPNVIFSSSTYGPILRYDRRTSFTQTVTPWPLGGFDVEISKRKFRDPWTPVLAFSPADKTSLYLGTQYVLKTVDGGLHWETVSPDLTGTVAGADTSGPTTLANAQERGYGVVYAIAPSPLDAKEIWAGSDTGLIHLTRDGGKTWSNVTPPEVHAWQKIAMIEASHFDAATAYATVDAHRLSDRKPYLYITHDYGKSWKLSVDGIHEPYFLNAVREDPKKRGLLFGGTEFGIFSSSDDGAHWESLQRNLPVTSVRDMTVHGDDLIVATHGRSFWILDDITPMRRQIEAKDVWLYEPAVAVRVDNDKFLGTPLPPEEVQAHNPPDGAILDYTLKAPAQQVTLTIYDVAHHEMRHFSNDDKVTKHPVLPIAERWFPAPRRLSAEAGEHRFVWDLYSSASGTGFGDDDADTINAPSGPRVPPGVYTVELDVDGRKMQQKLTVSMDPRAKVTTETLEQKYKAASEIYAATLRSRRAMAEIQSVQKELAELHGSVAQSAELTANVSAAEKTLEEIVGTTDGSNDGLNAANTGLTLVLRTTESGHRGAPASTDEAYRLVAKLADERIERWTRFKANELAQLNKKLQASGAKQVQVSAIEQAVQYYMTR